MSHEEEKSRQPRKLTAPSIVKPRVSRFDPRIFNPVILSPAPPLTELAARLYRARAARRALDPARVYHIKKDGRAATMLGPAMGAPAAVVALERAVAHGVRHVIALGLCGSLSPEVKIGSFVVPLAARVEEGVSAHYVENPKESFPGSRALAAVEKAFSRSGRSFHKGPVWTTDALFRETTDKVREYGGKGLLAVEMEMSALFTVAEYRGIELAGILVVSDELFDLTWRTGFTRPRFLMACRHAARIALDAAFLLAGDEEGEPEEAESSKEQEKNESKLQTQEEGEG